MNKPFQFSIQRLLGATACFAVAAGLFKFYMATTHPLDGFPISAFVAAIGAGIGALFGHPVKGAAISILILGLLGMAAMLLFSFHH